MSFLEISGLHKHYGPVAALAGVDLSVSSGSRTAIVGPSGCGKTTLLWLIASLRGADQGRIVSTASAGQGGRRCRRIDAASAWWRRTAPCSRI